MPFRSREFFSQVEAKVQQIESVSQAEIVVLVSSRSGSYADVDLRWALVMVFATLAFILHSSFVFSPNTILLDVCLMGLLGWFCSGKSSFLRRLLTSRKRRLRQATHSAAQAFTEENVSATLHRSGILLYVSLLERELVVLPDIGVDARMPRAEWGKFVDPVLQASSLADMEAQFLQGLDGLAECLAKYLPASEVNLNELDDYLRFRR